MPWSRIPPQLGGTQLDDFVGGLLGASGSLLVVSSWSPGGNFVVSWLSSSSAYYEP